MYDGKEKLYNSIYDRIYITFLRSPMCLLNSKTRKQEFIILNTSDIEILTIHLIK